MIEEKGYITEIFKSIQGEGIYLGIKQLFIRFSGCNLRCKNCDTKYALKKTKSFKFLEEEIKNPINAKRLNSILEKIEGGFHSLSLTGGEPLLQINFLKSFLQNNRVYKIYLESNGILYKELDEVIEQIDIISMDIKLPSFSKMAFFKKEHREFLKVAKGKDIFIKMVISRDTDLEEIIEAVEIVEEIDREIPLIFQPQFYEKERDFYKRILYFQEKALENLKEVRIIPQIHKFLCIK
jgi:organic radical activating enzyme